MPLFFQFMGGKTIHIWCNFVCVIKYPTGLHKKSSNKLLLLWEDLFTILKRFISSFFPFFKDACWILKRLKCFLIRTTPWQWREMVNHALSLAPKMPFLSRYWGGNWFWSSPYFSNLYFKENLCYGGVTLFMWRKDYC